MSIAVANAGMTTEELLELPENGTDRWLIRGELREKPMTVRNRFHSEIMAIVAAELVIWLRSQGQPRGKILCGEAGVRLRRNPDTTVGIDVAYISAEVAARQSDETTLIDGVPTLAVEILSPSDTLEETHEKIMDYLAAGVALVWVIDPYDQAVRCYRPGVPPEFFNNTQELAGQEHLPGFSVPVARLFA